MRNSTAQPFAEKTHLLQDVLSANVPMSIEEVYVRRSFAAVALLIALVPCFAVAQDVVVRKKPDPNVPPFGVMLKRSTVQLDVECNEGTSSAKGSGTGFLVRYGDSRLPSGSYFYYLVTNRHVAECWDERNRPREVRVLAVRANTKDGSVRILSADPKLWYFPADSSVDLAVMPVRLPDGLQIVVFSEDDFATKDFMSSNQVAEGQPIILSGYFYQFPGQRRFEPIIRQGILSMIPDEPMTTTTGKPGTLYLGEVHIFGGNSGSPVVVGVGPLAMDGYRLLGVVSGYYYEDAEFKLEIATNRERGYSCEQWRRYDRAGRLSPSPARCAGCKGSKGGLLLAGELPSRRPALS